MKVFIVALALVIIALLALGLFVAPVTHAPKTRTQYNLRMAYLSMTVFEDETRKPITQLFAEISTSASARAKWKALVAKSEVKDGIEPGLYEKSLCYDGYGRLFNVEFKTNLATLKAASSLTRSEFDAIIWSSGRNGTNEYGNGDDIMLPPDVRLK